MHDASCGGKATIGLGKIRKYSTTPHQDDIRFSYFNGELLTLEEKIEERKVDA